MVMPIPGDFYFKTDFRHIKNSLELPFTPYIGLVIVWGGIQYKTTDCFFVVEDNAFQVHVEALNPIDYEDFWNDVFNGNTAWALI